MKLRSFGIDPLIVLGCLAVSPQQDAPRADLRDPYQYPRGIPRIELQSGPTPAHRKGRMGSTPNLEPENPPHQVNLHTLRA
jgi:hypothetical protein